MFTSNHSHAGIPGPGWQLLGELELPAGRNVERTIQAWLIEILAPLRLREDFLRRILESAQEAAGRAFQAGSALRSDHAHLLVHIPQDHDSKAGTWGFFRLEKIEETAEDITASAHAIEFYLYVEGQEDHA